MNRKREQLRNAFSMVELLVVLGIVAIATAVLLPAVQTVRRTAATTKCADNLRTLGLAITAYVNDHQYYPYGFYIANDSVGSGFSLVEDIGSSPNTYVWWSVLRSYVSGGGTSQNNAIRSDDAVPFSRINDLFNCPEAPDRANGVDYVPNASVMVQKNIEEGGTTAHPINRFRNALSRGTGVYADTAILWDAPAIFGSAAPLPRKEQYVISYSIDAAPFTDKSMPIRFGLLGSPKKPSWRYRNVSNSNRISDPKNYGNESPIYSGINEDVSSVNEFQTAGGIRFRHGANNQANFLFADGSVRTHAMTLNWDTAPVGTLLRKYFRSKMPPGSNPIDAP